MMAILATNKNRSGTSTRGIHTRACSSGVATAEKKPEKGREAAAPSNIEEIQEIQGGQEAPLDGDAINPKDA